MKNTNANTVDAYIRKADKKAQANLKKIRALIKKGAPKAVETISYQIPAYKLNNRILLYFAAFKNHISLYPASDAMVRSIKGLSEHRSGRGTIKFLLSEPISWVLVNKVIKYKLKENSENAITRSYGKK